MGCCGGGGGGGYDGCCCGEGGTSCIGAEGCCDCACSACVRCASIICMKAFICCCSIGCSFGTSTNSMRESSLFNCISCTASRELIATISLLCNELTAEKSSPNSCGFPAAALILLECGVRLDAAV